jgi:Holliday junction DNA helicase RuvA
MIGYLTGKIVSLTPTRLLIDVNGVGYIVNITINTYEKLHTSTGNVSVFTYLNVKQDGMDLYGFHSQGEKDMFELLISINGIGPKLALGILSGIQTDELKDAIQFGNLNRIKAIPGIGKKTAERLVLELKDKISQVIDETTVTGSSGSYVIKTDAITALSTLGYAPKFAEKYVKQILDENPNIQLENLIKTALALLNK